MMNDLEQRQKAAKEVEVKMIDFLIQFTPADVLTVADAKAIARMAKVAAFDAFDPNK